MFNNIQDVLFQDIEELILEEKAFHFENQVILASHGAVGNVNQI